MMENFALTANSDKGKVDLEKLSDLIFNQGKSQKECAEIFGVNPSTITRNLAKLRARHPVPFSTDHQHQLIKYTDNVIDQLRKLHRMLTKELRYIHKVVDGKNIYFFANLQKQPFDGRVRLRGCLKNIESWNPHTGKIEKRSHSYVKEGVDEVTEITIKLAPIENVGIDPTGIGQKLSANLTIFRVDLDAG